MGGCAEGVSDNQERIVRLLILGYSFEQLVDLYLTEVAVGFDQLDPQKFLQLLVGGAHNRRIVLQIDLLTGFDRFHGLEGDVLGVPQSQSDYIKHHC